MKEIEYLEFLLSNRIHPEYSLRDIRREIEDRIRELKATLSTLSVPEKQVQNELFSGKYTSVCKICFKPIKTEPYCWEKHIENYHSDIEDKDNLEDFFMDLDLKEFEKNTENEIHSQQFGKPKVDNGGTSNLPNVKDADNIHTEIKQELDKDYAKTNESVGGNNG